MVSRLAFSNLFRVNHSSEHDAGDGGYLVIHPKAGDVVHQLGYSLHKFCTGSRPVLVAPERWRPGTLTLDQVAFNLGKSSLSFFKLIGRNTVLPNLPHQPTAALPQSFCDFAAALDNGRGQLADILSRSVLFDYVNNKQLYFIVRYGAALGCLSAAYDVPQRICRAAVVVARPTGQQGKLGVVDECTIVLANGLD